MLVHIFGGARENFGGAEHHRAPAWLRACLLLTLIASLLLTFHSVYSFFLFFRRSRLCRLLTLSFFFVQLFVLHTRKNFIVLYLFVFKLVTRLDIKLKTS